MLRVVQARELNFERDKQLIFERFYLFSIFHFPACTTLVMLIKMLSSNQLRMLPPINNRTFRCKCYFRLQQPRYESITRHHKNVSCYFSASNAFRLPDKVREVSRHAAGWCNQTQRKFWDVICYYTNLLDNFVTNLKNESSVLYISVRKLSLQLILLYQ